jgi:histidine triad (HIT) family protein
MSKTIFQRIIDREIPAQFVHEDDQVIAIRDVKPQAPVHLLVIPKKPIPSTDAIGAGDGPLIARIWEVIREVAKKENLGSGYRVVVNCGPDGGQTVDHLHFHLLGGRQMSWPPG